MANPLGSWPQQTKDLSNKLRINLMTRTWPGPLLVRFGGCVVALKTIITTTTRQLTIAEQQQCESCKLQQAAVQ